MSAAPVALTSGEPAGIGPEVAAYAWFALRNEITFFWIGDPRALPEGVDWHEIAKPSEAAGVMPYALPVLRHDFFGSIVYGKPDPVNAACIIEVIARAVQFTVSGDACAICTCPISKIDLKSGAGFKFAGHTEFLANLTGTERAVMMLVSDTLRVVPTTIHIPLAEVPAMLTDELLEHTIRICHESLRRDFAMESPRIVVSGLNPHAGEGGLMGDEERRVIAPVIARLATAGIAVEGPLSADTMFHEHFRAEYDAAVAMYHDQALIPIKTLCFDSAVNVTLGLPVIRTSPDHGTAFDIAGKGVANPSSLIEALRLASRMSQARSQV